MKALKIITLTIFILINTNAIGQKLNLTQIKRLTSTPEFSDVLMNAADFKRVSVEWHNTSYLQTQYISKDSLTIVIIGSSTTIIYCMIITKSPSYVNSLTAEAYNDDFIKDREAMKKNNNFPVLIKGKYKFGVAKEDNDIYKISLGRSKLP